jgi:hypothetical protein
LHIDDFIDSVIHIALEALEFLSMCASNKAIMIEELGLLENIERILNGMIGEAPSREVALRLKKVS